MGLMVVEYTILLERYNIKFDIIDGTSIRAVMLSFITGTKIDEPSEALQDFWLSTQTDTD